MKNSPYSPDEFMAGLYGKLYADPYAEAKTKEEALAIGKEIREKAKSIFGDSLETINKENK